MGSLRAANFLISDGVPRRFKGLVMCYEHLLQIATLSRESLEKNPNLNTLKLT
jgi:hypothetical protein